MMDNTETADDLDYDIAFQVTSGTEPDGWPDYAKIDQLDLEASAAAAKEAVKRRINKPVIPREG